MDFRLERGFTLAEAMDMVFNDNIEGDIFIEPPFPHVESDEDDADEDVGGLVDDVHRRQLTAPAELRMADNQRIGVDYERELNPVLENIVSPLSQHFENWKKEINGNSPPRWILHGDFNVQENKPFPVSEYSFFSAMSPIDIFERYFDDELIELILNETKKYAPFLNCPDPKITIEEIRCFFGILLVTGYNTLPSKRHYWDSGDDMKNNAICQAMRRNRFLEICRFLHFSDNTKVNNEDKAWKIRPIINALKKKCIHYFIPQQNLCYDESMIKYYGKHSCKQFIRGKPIRFGYKMWCLNTSDGYLVNFEMYQGKGPTANSNYDKTFGKASSPLVVLLEEIPDEKRNLPYNFYMDNLFSSPALFSFFRNCGYSATGTIRVNRIPKRCPLSDTKAMSKAERGSFETAVERNDGMVYVRWMDNAVVTMISSSCGSRDVKQTRRYSKEQKRFVMISQPQLIAKYNAYMGGTDLMDQNINTYRTGVRGKKWYWSIFTWLLDLAVHNSCYLYKKSRGTKVSLLEFRRELANTYLQKYQSSSKGAGRPSMSTFSASDNRISDNIRFDRMDHFVKQIEDDKKRRCAETNCKSIIRTMCQKCGIALCLPCFAKFHTR